MAPKPLRRAAVPLIAGGLLLSGAGLLPTCKPQTLARPGWAGSGLNGEPWWRSAVFYRIDPSTFQDSDGDGIGDLPGITSRLDYLQTLGVDAVILEPSTAGPHPRDGMTPSAGVPFAPAIDQPGFDDLISEGSRRHLRIVVVEPLSSDASSVLAHARSALSRGAAGIELAQPGPVAPARSQAPAPSVTSLPAVLAELRALAAGFPGERVVLSDLGPSSAGSASTSAGLATGIAASLAASRRPAALHLRGAMAPELIALPVLPAVASSSEGLSSLRSLVSSSESLPLGAAPLFEVGGGLAPSTAQANPEASMACLAVRLFTLRGAIVLNAGQELGLPLASRTETPMASSEASRRQPLMQWTPRNVTPPSVTIEPNPEPATPARSDVYGAYRPYVPVKPRPVTLPGAPQPPPDPDTLPGFTSGDLPSKSAALFEPARRNVAVEDVDPHSLLNLYRRLIAIHHGHATLRSGSTAVLEEPGTEAMVWVRRAPAGARTVASVVMACNLSGSPLSLSLDTALEAAHIRAGLLRPLLGPAAISNGPQSTAHLLLAPHGIYIGEIYHH